MGNRVRKSLQLVVGDLQLSGTFDYPVFQLLIEFADLKFICFSPGDIPEREHGTTHHSVLIQQRGTGSLNPESPVESGVTQKYLGGTSLPAKGAFQRSFPRWYRRDRVGQEEAVMCGPVRGGQG